mgnify:CR=1 FL=1
MVDSEKNFGVGTFDMILVDAAAVSDVNFLALLNLAHFN